MSGRFDLVNRIKVNNPYPNIDSYYGAWQSIQEACEKVPYVIREKGLTVGILENNHIKEYWWKNGIEDNDLEPKTGAFINFGYGEKKTGVDAGKEFELSITDDYLYICVTPGEAGIAVWKKIVLFQT